MSRGKFEKATYFSIVGGKFRERINVIADREQGKLNLPPNAEFRELFDDKGQYEKTVWEYVDDYLEGFIINIDYKTGNVYGDQWVISLNDNKETFKINISVESSYAQSFGKKIHNIDLSKQVMIIPWYIPDDKKSGLVFKQGGTKDENKVPNWINKDNIPEGYPMPSEELQALDYAKYTSKNKNDYRKIRMDRFVWIEEMIKNDIIPNIPVHSEYVVQSKMSEEISETEFDIIRNIDAEEKMDADFDKEKGNSSKSEEEKPPF